MDLRSHQKGIEMYFQNGCKLHGTRYGAYLSEVEKGRECIMSFVRRLEYLAACLRLSIYRKLHKHTYVPNSGLDKVLWP